MNSQLFFIYVSFHNICCCMCNTHCVVWGERIASRTRINHHTSQYQWSKTYFPWFWVSGSSAGLLRTPSFIRQYQCNKKCASWLFSLFDELVNVNCVSLDSYNAKCFPFLSQKIQHTYIHVYEHHAHGLLIKWFCVNAHKNIFFSCLTFILDKHF